MRHFRFLCVCMVLLGISGQVQAETLKGEKLRTAVSGKTIYLSMAMGIELPIKYRSGGTMFGQLKGFAAIIPSGMPSADKGRWWINRDNLCQAWNQWLKKKSYCYKLKQVKGEVIWHRNDGASGTARIVSH